MSIRPCIRKFEVGEAGDEAGGPPDLPDLYEEGVSEGDDDDEDIEEDPDDDEDFEGDAGGKGSTVGERYSLPKEGKFVRKLLDPSLPSRDEVDEHYVMGHLPYRNWCPVCIRAKGKDMDHQSDKGKERKLPEYGFDYCFPGDELGFKWTVLVGREKSVKSAMATALPEKGGQGEICKGQSP